MAISARLDMGAHIGVWAEVNPDIPNLPWRRIASDVFNLAPTNAVTHRLRRVYAEWLHHGAGGRCTRAGAGAETRDQRKRRPDDAAAPRRRGGEWISFELLQWFVDEVEAIKSRSDSRLLLDQARWLKSRLVEMSTLDAHLPKITKCWLYRWRKEHSISIRRVTSHFQ